MNSNNSINNYEQALCEWYLWVMKKELDLKNPRTFNEKIQWLKVNDATPVKTLCADKYLVRDWIKVKIDEKYLIPLLGVWDRFDAIEFVNLPDSFALKANHGCGWNAIVKDKNQFDIETARIKFDRWMQTNFAFEYGFELQYKDIKPKIIAEAYFESEYESQVWCFNGKPEFISVIDSPHGKNQKRSYNVQWEPLPFVTSLPKLEKEIACPANLEEMIAISKRLASDFVFVRVDFYLNKGCLKFGEMTFTPASGTVHWEPKEYDEIMGNILKIDL